MLHLRFATRTMSVVKLVKIKVIDTLLKKIMFGFAWCCDIVESLHDALQSLWINSDNSLSVFLGNFYAEERLRKKWASEKCMVSKKRLLVLRKYRRSLFPNLHILQRLRIRVPCWQKRSRALAFKRSKAAWIPSVTKWRKNTLKSFIDCGFYWSSSFVCVRNVKQCNVI